MRTQDDSQDVRALLGMHTGAAKVVVAVYIAAMGTTGLGTTEGVSAVWPIVVAIGLIAAGVIALIVIPGDPLPRGVTIVLAASGPVACALCLWVLPSPWSAPLQGWTHGAFTIVLCFMCVRGRRIASWISLSAVIIVYGVWGSVRGEGFTPDAAGVVVDATPVAMATILSFTLRPTAKAVFTLRARSERQVAEHAALTAAAAERTAQRRRLDRLARPLLTRIASGEPLDAEERLACELLEAHLRDHLRAPALSTPAVDEAALGARRRGVEVILIDDGGLDGVDPDIAARVTELVVAELSSATTGDVRARVLPPGRDALATVYVGGAHEPRRVTIGRDGRPV